MIDVTGRTNSIQNSAAIMSSTDVFVINLCASMTPMPSVPRSLKGYENHRLYQVARVEDGRHRYRLRMGFFNSEADAEIALASLRALYPAAFTSHAGAEDMRYSGDPLITGRFEARATTPATDARPSAAVAAKPEAKVLAKQPAVSAPTVASSSASPVISKTPAAKTAPASQPSLKPSSSIEPAKPAAPISLVDPPPAPVVAKDRATPFTMTTHQPFHVARGVDLPETDLELAPTVIPGLKKSGSADPQWVHLQGAASKSQSAQPPSQNKPRAGAATSLPIGKPAAKATMAVPAAATQPAKAAPVMAKNTSPVAVPARKADNTPAPAPVAKPQIKPAPPQAAPPAQVIAKQPHAPAPVTAKPAAKGNDDYVPILDTTMTIRTISMAEFEDANQPKWFCVQLAISEQTFNLDAMPRLDIFAAYRLYSVAVNSEDAKVKHSLRLGFFKEEVSADAVAGYLKTFFPAPTITRVSVAEYDRFIEPKVVAAAVVEPVVKQEEKREPGAAPSKPTFGVTPAPAPVRAKQKAEKPKWETSQPGYRPGPTGKYSIDTVKKNQSSPAASESGIRKNALRPQSFLSKLIGRELD